MAKEAIRTPSYRLRAGCHLVLAFQAGTEGRIQQLLQEVLRLVEQYGVQASLFVEREVDSLLSKGWDAHVRRVGVQVIRCKNVINAALLTHLRGEDTDLDRVVFVSDVGRVDASVLSEADCVFVMVRPGPYVGPPRAGCTLITSVYRSDEFLPGFVKNCTSLLGYDRLIEHIFLVSALSQAEEEVLLGLFLQRQNVLVFRFRTDPGLYECWNIGIRVARTDYVSNANVDDLRDPRHVVTLLKHLESKPDIAVAATAIVPFERYPAIGTLPPRDTVWYADKGGRFGFLDLARPVNPSLAKLEPHNMPHCMPVWRRSIHSRHGWFDESQFGTYADWAFWLKVFEGGGAGWLEPEPLGYYFVNPNSHNRRGGDLDKWHSAIEKQFLGRFISVVTATVPTPRKLSFAVQPKLHLWGRDLSYGQHRNSFSCVIEALAPLDKGESGCRFVPFIERQFGWGNSNVYGEAASSNPRPLTEPWIGILHVPFDAPEWFDHKAHPKRILSTSLFQASLPACRGIITLSDDLERVVNEYLPDIPTLALKHPTDLNVRDWDAAAYMAKPCVVQVGDWLRKLQSIHRLRTSKHRRIMLLKRWTHAFMRREAEVIGEYIDPAVEMRSFVSNEEYDRLLAESVVLCLMYATAANNVLLECIARATPILVNPLPGAVEYLGESYPLYVLNEKEAAAALEDDERIYNAHRYLMRRRYEIDLSYEGFCRGIAESVLYADI